MVDDFYYMLRWQIEEIDEEDDTNAIARVSVAPWTRSLIKHIDDTADVWFSGEDHFEWWGDDLDHGWLGLPELTEAVTGSQLAAILLSPSPDPHSAHLVISPLLRPYPVMPPRIHEDMVLLQIAARPRLPERNGRLREGELIRKLLYLDSAWVNYTSPAKRLARRVYSSLLGEEGYTDETE